VDNAIFIHCNLDDWGLRPTVFRVLCHVARRGDCHASVQTISKVCCIHKDTVRKALKELVNSGLLFSKYRQGATTKYMVNHSKIINAPPRKEGSTPCERNGVPPSEKKGGHPYESKGGKVYPTKSIPLSKSPSNMKMNRDAEMYALGKETSWHTSKRLEAVAEQLKEIEDRTTFDAMRSVVSWGEKGDRERKKQLKSEKKRLLAKLTGVD